MAVSPQNNSGRTFILPEINTLPNFRVVCFLRKKNSDELLPAIYRSSKPDRLCSEDIDKFHKLGIKNILDFRSLSEYRGSDGLCTLDKEYSIYKVALPSRKYTQRDSVRYDLILKSEEEKSRQETHPGSLHKKHFFVSFFNSTYFITLMRRLPWHLCLCGIVYLCYDLVMRNKFRNFVVFFMKHIINPGGIIGQYIDIIDLSGNAICAALKTATNPDNMPILINCAHGKDRTGIMTAFILTCLGMSPEYIAQEYSLSEAGLRPIYKVVHNEMVNKLGMKEEFLTAKSRTMTQLWDYINKKYGSIEEYLVSIGFSLEEQRALKENLVPFESQEVWDMCAQSEAQKRRDKEEEALQEDMLISDRSHFI